MKLKGKSSARRSTPRGRPRSFDADAALDKALKVFWRKGYEGASLPDLTRAMGINRPSLYAAFGNKQALFRKAIDRYAQGPASYVRKALSEGTARGVVQRLFDEMIQMLSNPKNPRGCLVVQGALACGDSAQGVRRELAARRESVVTTLRQRFERAKTEGDLPTHADAAVLARYVATVAHGLSIQAAGGASAEELGGVVETAMRAWPV